MVARALRWCLATQDGTIQVMPDWDQLAKRDQTNARTMPLQRRRRQPPAEPAVADTVVGGTGSDGKHTR